MPGPLTGIRVIEMDAIGPVPFCGMLLADMGADVIRIERVGQDHSLGKLAKVCGRHKRALALNLKDRRAVDVLLRLAATSDVLIEGFRPGVAESLGIGPEVLAARNPGLIYGRMTGWGQDGPLALQAGHDINFIALAGVLHTIGDKDPVPPLNLVGDYGGGALYLAVGVLAALHERTVSGVGQVVDAAMVDGAASLMAPVYELVNAGLWKDQRRKNYLDGEAPFYAVYETADGGHVAVGALEPQFFAQLLAGLGIDAASLPPQHDRDGWPQIRTALADAFAAQTRDHWETVFVGTDSCVTPVLSLEEAPRHVHNRARMSFFDGTSGPLPGPAPRFSRTPSGVGETFGKRIDSNDLLDEIGISSQEATALVRSGAMSVEAR